ncbi:MAG TPA: insulinase family protein [Clostridia bacterium]|nr:insulinase family protein [Clostridia bacterium]
MNYPEIVKIADGVRICAVKTNQFKTSKVLLTMALPLDENASANAVLPFILHRSCKDFPDFSSLNGKLAELYGAVISANVAKHGEAQLLSISITSIDDRFSLTDESIASSCAELLLKLIFEPKLENGRFILGDVEREKRLLLEKVASEQDNKNAYALHKCEEIMCKNEAFGIPKYGREESIKDITPDDVYNAWQRALKTSIMQITIVSSGNTTKIAKSFSERFSAIERNPNNPETQFIKIANAPQRVNEEQSVKQGKLVMGFRTGMENAQDKRFDVFIAVDLFGGGTYSKLFTNVREKMSLCYYCNAALQRQKGVFFVRSGIETQSEKKASDEILRQLELLQKGEVDDNEFNSSILSVCDRIKAYNDSPETLVAWYFSQILDNEILTPKQCSEKYQSVSLDDVVSVAKGFTLDTVFMLSGKSETECKEGNE